MKALVTGSTGFIGRRLCAMLTEQGWPPVVAKRGDDIHGIMRTTLPDVVFHLAGAYVRDHEATDVANLVQSNVEYGVQVLEAMRVCGMRRIVVASTLWALVHPVNLYAATKKAFEGILDYYRDAHGFSPTVLYLGDTYGPEDARGKIVSRMVDAALTEKTLDLSPGDQVLDLVHVDDVCQGFIHAAQSAPSSPWKWSLRRWPNTCRLPPATCSPSRAGPS